MRHVRLPRATFGADDARLILESTFADHTGRNFGFRLWDGQEVRWGDSQDFTIVFTDADTFRRCAASGDPADFGEAYVDGHMLIEGDLWAAVGLSSYLRASYSRRANLRLAERARLALKLGVPSWRRTVEDERRDVRAHYDLSDDLFRLFLDDKMVYSCAYFASATQTLERAQERKLDLICKKLDLRPSETFLDVGCGWGALVMWAARYYGVRSYGITLSENQAAEGRRRAAVAGLSDRVKIEVGHYADLPADAYDKISSVGMYEHVGIAKLPLYLGKVFRALRPGGLFLNHGITSPPHGLAVTGGDFVFRHVFPGADFGRVADLQVQMERASFEIVDVHSLRPHYALTLREWFRRFRRHRDQAARLVPERVVRALELYLAACAQAFDDGILSVHQVLVAKRGRHGESPIPLSRAETFLWT